MPVINIKIKSSGDKKYNVEVDTEATIEDLKVLISAVADVPPENQRLIYSGKFLKDPETVASYKIQNDHSVHLVRNAGAKGANPATAAATGSPSQSTSSATGSTNAIPANLAAGQGSFNPLADLTGARYAGYAQLPSASMFGPDGGMGAFQDPEQLEQLILSPALQQQMNAVVLNPQMMDMLLSQNPQFRDMSPEARQALQPMFREMLTNPESLRSIISLNRAFSASGGGAGGFPAPGNPLGDSNSSHTAADSDSAVPAALPGFGAQGVNPFASIWNPSLVPPPAADNRPPEERYENQLRQLNEMGFSDFEMNVAALRRSGGHVQGAIDYLLSLSNF